MKQCLIKFGPATNEGNGTFTFQAGVSPSRATIHTRLGAVYPQIGTMRITDGSIFVDFPNCRVVRHTIVSTGGRGRWRQIIIEDRRWRWWLSRISGEYNELDRGSRDIATQKSARKLAALCLDRMGETGYNVTALPDDAYPQVAWDSEVAPVALDAICQEFGCVVVLNHRSNTVRVWKVNAGSKPLIDSRAMDATPSQEPQVVPPQLIFEGGPTLWQRDLLLEPIGIETQKNREVIRPIDELSYKPTTGWESEDPRAFYGVDEEKRDLAKRCIWKMFRVKPPFKLEPPPTKLKVDTDKVANFFTVASDELWRILPLQPKQLASRSAPDNSQLRDAVLVGAFIEGKVTRANNADKTDYDFTNPEVQLPAEDDNPFLDYLVYQEGFHLDAAAGIVVTGRPVYYLENGECKAPYLRLRTSFGLRHKTTRNFVCQQFYFNPPNPTLGAVTPETVKQGDVVFSIQEGRGAAQAGQISALTNANDFIALAQTYLLERINALYPDEAISIPYKGFVFDYGITGATRAISWSTSPAGGSTVVDYAIERPELRKTHAQLREQAQQLAFGRQQVAAKKALNALLRKNPLRPIR